MFALITVAPFSGILLPAIVFCATAVPAQGPASTRQELSVRHGTPIEEFTAAVNEYVELHRLLENPLADLTLGADPERTARARRAHRLLIHEMCALAYRPRIFTPRVSDYLRERIRPLVSDFRSDPENWPLATAIDALPQLPVEVAYRFEGTNLVLVDVETDLVVDVLEHALPVSFQDTSEPGLIDPDEMCAPEPLPVIKGSPCDAHEELDMCWS